MKDTLKIHHLRPKLYIGGWYIVDNPFNYIPLTVAYIVVMDMWNLYLN